MNYTYSTVRNPRWSRPNHSAIDCLVKFDHFKFEVPFTATAYDQEPYNREIFRDCEAGKYGSVAEFSPDYTDEPAVDQKSNPSIGGIDSWPELQDFLDEANRENASGTLRGQVLIWSSMIELLIGRLLESFLVDHNITRKMLEGPQFTFSTNTDLVFSLGIISKSEHLACSNIRKIRNEVAHKWAFTLENQRIATPLRSLYDADHSDMFHWVDDLSHNIKMIYSGSCSMLAINLANRQKVATNAKRFEFPEFSE